jgi:hypothetical protein
MGRLGGAEEEDTGGRGKESDAACSDLSYQLPEEEKGPLPISSQGKASWLLALSQRFPRSYIQGVVQRVCPGSKVVEEGLHLNFRLLLGFIWLGSVATSLCSSRRIRIILLRVLLL